MDKNKISYKGYTLRVMRNSTNGINRVVVIGQNYEGKTIKQAKAFVNKYLVSVKATLASQLKADPQMELRRKLQEAGMNRRIEEARKALA